MIIVYAQSGGSLSRALTLTVTGHAAIAVTRLQRPKYLSYVTQGESIRDRYSRGPWSKTVYRIQIPSQQDGNGSVIDEQAVYDFYANYPNTGLDCVGVAYEALRAAGAGAYHKRWHWPVTSPSGLASWASDLQRYMIANPQIVGWPHEDVQSVAFFTGDDYHWKHTDAERNRLNGRGFNNAAALARVVPADMVGGARSSLVMQRNFDHLRSDGGSALAVQGAD